MIENFSNGEPLRISPEIRKKIISPFSSVEVNGFRTFKTEHLSVNNVEGIWHFVKGGGETKFKIFFNPDTREWLKTVDPEVKGYQERYDRLREGAKIVRKVHEMARLPLYAEKVEECITKRDDGRSTYGHKTAHTGSTQQYINKQLEGAKIDLHTSKFLSTGYIKAFNLAAQLYVMKGIWTSDPNPGNIVYNFDNPDDIKVTLIDFEKLPQYRGVDEEGFSELFELFEKEAEGCGIYISRKHKDIVNPNVLFSERKKFGGRVSDIIGHLPTERGRQASVKE